MVYENVTEKIDYKYFRQCCSYFVYLFIIIECKDIFFYMRVKSMFCTVQYVCTVQCVLYCTVCSVLYSVICTVQFTLPVFAVSSFRGRGEASKTQNSTNGPVGYSWNHAIIAHCQYCTKFSNCYLNTNVSRPVFRSSSIIMCNWQGVSSENFVIQVH